MGRIRERFRQNIVVVLPTAQQAGPQDIWSDQLCMQRLVSGDMPDTTLRSERDRISKRVRRFGYNNGLLYCMFADGSKREVPRPAERTDIAGESHDDSWHFGIK